MKGKLVFVNTEDGQFFGARVIKELGDNLLVRTTYGKIEEIVVKRSEVTLQDGEEDAR